MRKAWRLLFASWVLLCLLLCLGLAKISQQGFRFETDLQALLPEGDSNALRQQAGRSLFELGNDRIMLLVASPTRDAMLAAADWLHQQLQENRLLRLETNTERSDQLSALVELYREHRFSLLSSEQRQHLRQGEAPLLAGQAMRALYQPGNWASWLTPSEDPLNLFPDLLLALQPIPGGAELADNYLILRSPEKPDWRYALIIASSEHTAFDLEAQQQLVNSLDLLASDLLQSHPDTQLLRSGIVFHAAAAARQARHEIGLIGGGSAMGIMVLFLLCFATPKPLLLSLASVLFGALVALCLCHFLFGSLHLLTLVFGASLIGVAIDYSLHYFTRLYGAGASTAEASLRQVFPGILLALITSVIGYASLAQAPLPGLRQIATFSVAGLIGAWLFVVAVYPRLAAPKAHQYPFWLVRLAQFPWRIWQGAGRKKGYPLVIGLGLVALLVCQQQLRSAEDVRALYQPGAALQQQEQQIQALFPEFAANQFLLLRAADAEDLLRLDEKLQLELENLRANDAIAGWRGISNLLPSAGRQQQDYELLAETVYGDNGVAWPLMASIGFEGEAISGLKHSFESYAGNWLLPGAWLEVADEQQRMLWLHPEQGAASMVTLAGVKQLPPLQALAARWSGVEFVDRVAQLSQLLNAQRSWAGQLLLLAYGAVMLLLAMRYHSLRAAMLVLIPLLASLLTLAILALAAIPISIFHVFALFLVLGLGMDYSIFAFEAQAGDSDYQLAILLSAVTSGLSFGLLALSNTPMVQAFGITILLGSICNLLLVPSVRQLLPAERGR